MTAVPPKTHKHALPICDHVPQPYEGPSREEVLALRRQYLTPGLITYYREPLMVVDGEGVPIPDGTLIIIR